VLDGVAPTVTQPHPLLVPLPWSAASGAASIGGVVPLSRGGGAPESVAVPASRGGLPESGLVAASGTVPESVPESGVLAASMPASVLESLPASPAPASTGVHTPPMHCPPVHAVPSVTGSCAGHVSDEPVHVDCWRHAVAAAHTKVLGAGVSVGQAGLTPSHASARSHAPLFALQTVPLELMPLGHCAVVPVQFWFESQVPAAVWHMVVLGLNVSAGHGAVVPVQLAPLSHAPSVSNNTNDLR
jgi:hypothetical protein